MKSQPGGSTRWSENPALVGDAAAAFATGDPHICVDRRPVTPPPACIGLAILGVSAVLALALGCARPQPSVADGAPVPSVRQAVIDRVVDSSVKIAIERNARRVTSASGIVIASRPAGPDTEPVSYVLTAAHALIGGEGAMVSVGFCGPHAARGKFPATVISQATPDTLDLALLRVSGIAVPPVAFPQDDSVSLGQPILVVGFPEGQRVGLSGGIISQVPLSERRNGIPADRPDQRIVIDAAAPRGVSGGGVFAVDTGRLVGIVQGHQTVSMAVRDQAQSYTLKFPVPGATFVVPLAQIRPFLTSPEAASELQGLLPLTARAISGAPE
jgi:serine protease Do